MCALLLLHRGLTYTLVRLNHADIEQKKAKRFELDHPPLLYAGVPPLAPSSRNGNQVSLKGLLLLRLLDGKVVMSGTRDYRGIVS